MDCAGTPRGAGRKGHPPRCGAESWPAVLAQLCGRDAGAEGEGARHSTWTRACCGRWHQMGDHTLLPLP